MIFPPNESLEELQRNVYLDREIQGERPPTNLADDWQDWQDEGGEG